MPSQSEKLTVAEKKTATAKQHVHVIEGDPDNEPVEHAHEPTPVDETPPIEVYAEEPVEPKTVYAHCANTRCNNGNPFVFPDNFWVLLRGGNLFCSDFCAQYGVVEG